MDVEAMLAKNIWRIGGVQVKDIVGGSPGFDNADFLFKTDNVIAELKCLDEDLINDPQFIQKATAIHLDDLQRSGELASVTFGDALVTTQGRTPEFIKAIRGLYYEPLRRSIKKANKQIKVTAEKLGIENAMGLLVVANNNHSALDPWHALELLKEAFRRETFSGINSVLYLSAGQSIEVDWATRQLDVVIEYRVPNKLEIDRWFIKRFNQVWMGALGSHRGSTKPGMPFEVGSDVLLAIRNKPRGD